MRYVLDEDRDDIEQRCLDPKCDFVNGVHQEPRRNCPLCCGPLGAFRAYGTEQERAKRLTRLELTLKDWTG